MGLSFFDKSFHSSSRFVDEKEAKNGNSNNRASTSMGMKTEYAGFFSMND